MTNTSRCSQWRSKSNYSCFCCRIFSSPSLPSTCLSAASSLLPTFLASNTRPLVLRIYFAGYVDNQYHALLQRGVDISELLEGRLLHEHRRKQLMKKQRSHDEHEDVFQSAGRFLTYVSQPPLLRLTSSLTRLHWTTEPSSCDRAELIRRERGSERHLPDRRSQRQCWR